jgi:lipoyl(octanoyl) transferase
MIVHWTYIGLTPYLQAMELMNNLKRDLLEGAKSEYILFLEHPNVITKGYAEKDNDSGLVSSTEDVKAAGFEIVQSNRGGRTTLHNPGQLVCYLVFDLKRNKLKVRQFVDLLEQTMMEVLNTYDLNGERQKDDPGVFVNGKKVGFIGLNVEDYITTHGVAINVKNDLRPFNHIVPCGQMDRPITSLYELLDGTVSVYDVYWRFISCFESLTGYRTEEVSGTLLF